jgi:hypothetical protein
VATIGNYTFDWIDDAEVPNMLGNPRPKTLQDIENSPYWSQIFERWVNCKGDAALMAKYTACRGDPKGQARSDLKDHGGDVRQRFYDDLGGVKAAIRQHDIDSGQAEKRIDDALGI